MALLASGCSKKSGEPNAKEEKPSVNEAVAPEKSRLKKGESRLNDFEAIFGKSELKESKHVWLNPKPTPLNPTRLMATFNDGGMLEKAAIHFEDRDVNEVHDRLEELVGEIPLRREISGERDSRIELVGLRRTPSESVLLMHTRLDFPQYNMKKPGTILLVSDPFPLFDNLADLSTPADGPYFRDEILVGESKYLIQIPYVTSEVGRLGLTQLEASDGASFVVVPFSIENVGSSTRTAAAADLALVDHENRTFLPANRATTAEALSLGIELVLTQLQPGIPRNLVAVFEVPDSAVRERLKLVLPQGANGEKTEVTFIFSSLHRK